MILSLRIALRFHQSFKRNTLISLISFISIIIIAIGISTAILVLSIINGFEFELNHRILSVVPHGEITKSANISFVNWNKVLNCIKKIPNIIYTNPYIRLSGVIEYNNQWHVVYIKSIDLSNNINIYNHTLINFIEKKSWKYFCEHKNQIILGEGVAIALNIREGDWITILFANNFHSEKGLLLLKKAYVQVSGILKLHSQLDNNLAIISFSDVQKYSNNKLDIDGIEFSVNNAFDIGRIIEIIKCKIRENENIQVHSWMDIYGYIYRDIQIVRIIIYLSMILIMAISCFSVITTLFLSIKNKNYDIAILRVLGARDMLIQSIFLWYGFFIYCIASILGSSIGIYISMNLKNISTRLIRFFEINISPREIYFIDFIPVQLKSIDVFIILGIVLLLGLLINWISLWKTKKINLSRILK